MKQDFADYIVRDDYGSVINGLKLECDLRVLIEDEIYDWINENYKNYINPVRFKIELYSNFAEMVETEGEDILDDFETIHELFDGYKNIIIEDSIDKKEFIHALTLEFEENECYLVNDNFNFEDILIFK